MLLNVRKQIGHARLMKPQTNGRTGPPSVNDDGSGFSGESKHCIGATRFLSRRSTEEKDTKMGKVAKDERTIRGKATNSSKCNDKYVSESKYTQLKPPLRILERCFCFSTQK